jgi:hypothetical protein
VVRLSADVPSVRIRTSALDSDSDVIMVSG